MTPETPKDTMSPTMTPAPYTASPERLAAALPEFVGLLKATMDDDAAPVPDGAPFVTPVEVNADTYLAAEAAGVASFVALRDLKGTMVGAAASWVQPHIHTGVPSAVTDRLFVTPEAREHGGAMVLFEAVKADLAQRGTVRWMVGEKSEQDRPIDLAEQGFRPVGTYHAAWIA